MFTIKRNNKNILLREQKVSCSCCECKFDIDNIRTPTQTELVRSFGKTCGRRFERPDSYDTAVWPTLPCIQGGQAVSGLLGNDAFNSPAQGRYRKADACLRFYYRIVNEERSEGGLVLREGEVLGGARPLKSGIELWLPYREDKPNLFVGESCGMYIYKFNFLMWNSTCSDSPNAFWTSKGGAQPPECQILRVYDVDMFYVTQSFPFTVWPPPEFLEEGWLEI
jgi:hypothetical protein